MLNATLKQPEKCVRCTLDRFRVRYQRKTAHFTVNMLIIYALHYEIIYLTIGTAIGAGNI